MRDSCNSKEWILDNTGKLLGLSLGYAHCSEHGEEIGPMHRFFGISAAKYPVGVVNRKITVCPPMLTFVEYDYVPRDKRRKSYKAASLMFRDSQYDRHDMTHQQLLKSFELDFYSEPNRSDALPQDDMMCAWDPEEFGVHVRGDNNIAKLRHIYEAMQALDVAIGRPTSEGFMRSGLAFVIFSAVPADADEAVTQADLAHKRLHEAADASGVYEMMKNTGTKCIALSPDWYDREAEEGLIFFVHPTDQQNCRYGWFNLQELTQWANYRTGPIMRDTALETFAQFRKGWENNLLNGLRAHGLNIRHHAWLEWLDEGKTQVGIRIRPSKESAAQLPEGLYPFDELMDKFSKVPEAA